MELIGKSTLLTLSIFLFAIVTIFLIGNKFIYSNKQNTWWNRFIKSIPIGAVLLTIIATLILDKKVEIKDKKEQALIIDSLNIYRDSIVSSMSKKDSMIDFIKHFLSNKRNDSTLSIYYADTVNTFYLRKNVTLNKILKERSQNSTQYPKTKVSFNPSDIYISNKPDGTTKMIVKIQYYQDSTKDSKNMIYVIKLNTKGKVFFIKNFEPLEKNDDL